MAVKASVTITISKYRDTDSVTRYYKLQASTAAAPAVPTTLTPSGWSTSEPTYTSGSTNTLYYTDCIVFSDGTFQYTDDGNGKAVKSSSYEAAKEAYNKAQAAQNSVNSLSEQVPDPINGTQTTNTRFWEGVATFSELVDGQQILYWNPRSTAYTDAGNKTVGVDMRVNSTTTKTAGTNINSFESGTSTNVVWLNLTLSNGNKTGWIPCYYGGASRLTGHYDGGKSIHFTYKVNADVVGVKYTGWFADGNYDSGNNFERLKYQANIKAGQQYLDSGRLIGCGDDGYVIIKRNTSFRLDKPILWTGGAIAIIGVSNNVYLMYSAINLQYNIGEHHFIPANETISSSAKWYRGDKITGTSTTPTIFSNSGVSSAVIGDRYTNSSTGYVYECTVAGAASVAKWKYKSNTRTAAGLDWYSGNKITGTSTTPTIFSNSGISNAGVHTDGDKTVGDFYFNTSTGNYYECTVGGNASTAKWVYKGVLTQQYGTLYIRGNISGNVFTTDDVPFTTVEPSSEDGLYYIAIGTMYNFYQYAFSTDHPIYKYINGEFRNISEAESESRYVSLSTEDSQIRAYAESTRSLVDVNTGNINSLQQSVNNLIITADGIKNDFSKIGGDNLCKYALELWDTSIGLTESDLNDIKINSINGRGYILGNGSAKQSIPVQNGDYTISFKYKKIGASSTTATVKINNEPTILTSSSWEYFEKTINVSSNNITLEFTGTENNIMYIADIMINSGDIAEVWSQNPNETRTDTVTIGRGIRVENSQTQTYTKIDDDGTRVFNKNNDEEVARFTKDGIDVKEQVVRNKSELVGVLIQQIGEQTWFTSIL